ncbi:16S rRNA (cytidine(1402)-2'-O)-methyltransferase [Lactobacillus acetotolerans]|jgi:16S rRNA (cytidine1402-2'-O)-methyltransferase|uniref:Ribosomal RNA small subunit methyltransferase I n=1 Tax=Lactobacillus acetotolerans TaxID=1600 RepID=A0A0D6A2U8_9LACO|nr:16S rRNA (cytidine(1402)-2'-O)-methyltransferase [Lactobacillus acetotolerans]KRN42125.1 methyltransferase [Lactobacillus acetotolerans DSM 20749 = JCM 3825]MBN7276034.1 16S rRNA (cytidine(1402)-2'-O)-methyltransferase [Lactobacillus acetotolerans]QFG50926.1 16S rRNA (cytidine(1402)-2'-O)-methyltransferase [Lactobacillus acetotolerans]QGV04969.1 16S rRNA (cytidine(1402)-2'-O)-methyltransferase [Lactobacillus acetotolerans]QJD72471.1 16S rRNA (cytidine(1402)-2'-O)-methyltransferase [Lactobac
MQRQSSYAKDSGKLYLVPTPIGNLDDITIRAKKVLTNADYIAAEDTRTSGILLEKIGVHNRMLSFHKYNSKERAPELIKLMQDGVTIAEISDAGMPVISDPGYILVEDCIKHDIPVVPLPGPSAFATALIGSGFDAQPFTYYGFLPRKQSEQKPYFEEMNKAKATSIFYEAPHRLVKTLKNMAQVFPADRKIVAARELTKIHEEFIRGTVAELNSYFAKTKPRGEFVILVSANTEKPKQLAWPELIQLVNNVVKQGKSKKDAIKQIAKNYHVSKNELYDKYHQK